MHLAPSHRTLAEPPSPPIYAGRKLRQVDQVLMWAILHDDPQCPTRMLLDKIAQSQPPIKVSLRQVNRWRARWQHPRPKGRPRGSRTQPSGISEATVVHMTPQLALVGVHVLSHWLDQLGLFDAIVSKLQQAAHTYRQRHPDDDFALLQQQFPELSEPQYASRFLVWPFVNLHAIMRLQTHSMASF